MHSVIWFTTVEQVFDRITTAVKAFGLALDGLDPASMSGHDAAGALDGLIRLERRIAAVRLALALRAAEANGWRDGRARSAEEWLAAKAGISVGAARTMLQTSKRLESLPVVQEALAKGEVSETQANQIADAAAAAPDEQSKLVEAAKHESHRGLRDECARTKADADPDPKARRDRIHRERHLRWWTDPHDGAWRVDGRMAPDLGARVQRWLERATDKVFAAARAAGIQERREAYAADALVELAGAGDASLPAASASATVASSGARKPSCPRRDLVVLIDLEALRRGRAVSGETCEIVGVGPVPVEVAAELDDDPFLKAVIKQGRDIRTVAHFGRKVPEELRTALFVRDRGCAVPGCAHSDLLQVDHASIDFADDGPLAMWNTDRLCVSHHRQKNVGYFMARDVSGRRAWIAPAGLVACADAEFDPTKLAKAPPVMAAG